MFSIQYCGKFHCEDSMNLGVLGVGVLARSSRDTQLVKLHECVLVPILQHRQSLNKSKASYNVDSGKTNLSED